MKKALAPIFLTIFLLSLIYTAIPVQAQTIYHYTLYGPVPQISGSISLTDTLYVTMRGVNSTTAGDYSLLLNNANSPTTINSTTPIPWISWNASSIQNFTASIWPNPTATTESYQLFTTETGYPTYLYTFPVADFAGMTHPYIQDINSRGVLEEQFSLNSVNPPIFIMPQFQSYTLKIICDQGVYSQSFTAGNTLSTNLQVLSGSFPVSYTNASEANATRTTLTNLQIRYVDPDLATTALVVTVTHTVNGAPVTDIVDSTVSNSYLYNLAVNNATDYNIRIQATRYGTIMEWDLVSIATTGTNPFTGLFDFLGTFPAGVDPSQIVGAAIIMLFLGLGSFRSAGVSCILAWAICGILIAIGWYSMGIPMFVFTGFLTFIVIIQEGKETAREA